MTEVALSVIFWLMAGQVLRRAGYVRLEFAHDVTRLVLSVTLPALIIHALHGISLAGPDGLMPLLAWALTFTGLVVSGIIARAWGMTPQRTGAFVLAATFANTTFLGYPLVAGFFPAPAPHLSLAILFDQLGATFAVNTVGAGIAARCGGSNLTLLSLAARLARFPPLWGLVIGLIFKDVALPGYVSHLLLQVGSLTIPLMLLCMGVQLETATLKGDRAQVLVAVACKLLLLPLTLWCFTSMVGISGARAQAAVLEAAMPSMFYDLALALTFGLDAAFVLQVIVVSTAFSFVTVPLWHAWLIR